MSEPPGISQEGDGLLFANTGAIGGDVTLMSATEPFRLEQFPHEPLLDPADIQRSSLSILLRSVSRVVPFVGRTAELSQLSSWRDGTSRLSVLLVYGPGGQGKTRLAAQFAEDSARAGWTVAQARHQSDPQPALPKVGNTGTVEPGALIVVDYAERWPRLDLDRLLQHRFLRGFDRVRILLLARPAGYWWKALTNPLTKMGATVEQLALGPLADTAAQRKVAFAAARNRFAEALGVAGVAGLQPAGSLADSAYDLALTLHMAALVAVDAWRRDASTPDDPRGLSAYLVRREYDHWQTLADNGRISITTRTMARLVALATLTQSLPLPEAVELLLLVGLAGNRTEAQSLLDDHLSCYPSEDDQRLLRPLLPDRLGEDFLADLMPAPNRAPGNGDAWMARILPQLLPPTEASLPHYGPAVLSVLVETARRWGHVREQYLVPLLLDRPQLALGAGGASLATLAGYADLDLLTALDAVLPEQRHVELDGGIAALTRRLTGHALTQTDDEAVKARLCDELAVRLSHAGLFEDAVSANEDAVAVRRRLAEADPARHEAALANSLGNLGIDLWNVGRPADALDAMTEAVDIYRRLVCAEPGAYEDDLGAELNNLAGALIGLDRYAGALAPAEEAAAIFRS